MLIKIAHGSNCSFANDFVALQISQTQSRHHCKHVLMTEDEPGIDWNIVVPKYGWETWETYLSYSKQPGKQCSSVWEASFSLHLPYHPYPEESFYESARGTSHKSNTATQPVTATRPEATSAQSGHGITSHLCLDLGTWHVAHCGTARWIEFVHLCITYHICVYNMYIYILDIDSKLGFGESSGGSMLTRKEELKIGRWHSDSPCWGCDSNVGLKTGYPFPISAVILRYTS